MKAKVLKGGNFMDLICLEMGILLSKNHPDFDIFKAYDYNYGYSYTDSIAYEKTEKEKAINFAKEYVKTGEDKSYAIITNQNSLKNINDPKIVDDFIYDIKNIIYSITKINGKIFENFINKKNDLLIGGIYTNNDKMNSISIILSEKYFIRLVNSNLNYNNQEINKYISSIKNPVLPVCRDLINLENISGYLGQLSDENLQKLKK